MTTPSTRTSKEAFARKQPVTREYLVPVDDEQSDALTNAKRRLSLAAMAGSEEETAKAKEALDAVRADIRERGLALTFRGVGRRRFDELINEHPPTEEQRKEDEKLPDEERRTFNPDTFWPALLAETVDSDLTAAGWDSDVLQSDAWNAAELKELKDIAWLVNTQSRTSDLGN